MADGRLLVVTVCTTEYLPMKPLPPPSTLPEKSLIDGESQQFLLNDVLRPLIHAARDPNSELHGLLNKMSTWVTENAPALQQWHDQIQLANERADRLMELIKEKISLADFLKLDPIDPYTLLLVAHKITAQAGAHAELGEKMSRGRKPGTVSPIVKLIAKQLERNPDASAAEIWDAIQKKQPAGMTLVNGRNERYIEYFDKKGKRTRRDTGYKRFCNLVTDQRKLTKRR
jgi:hypothetical protein